MKKYFSQSGFISIPVILSILAGGKFDIYLSEWNGASWSVPANSGKVAEINSLSANDIGPFISRDGSKLYFSSNRSGTNNYDIYYSSRSSTGDSWQTPISLGATVNLTNESELGPTLNEDETLIFFARGWPQGAAETSENLFYSEKKNGQWITPVSWEHNTLAIEDNPELSSDGKTMYFSSKDRSGGHGNFDVYVSYCR